ncbi:hypothetical protein XB05_08380 [Xanthomonas arboricola]|uniref:hypothetical protein n=1 Tax=Xanthomonas arboricola TaxID=56448 RepID=UPI00061A3185|nr:hypothetical protein [Xanthomonas arboricola]AKC78737.1 hypothetical protein XB05_08380 [Xanthomonas arboricola]
MVASSFDVVAGQLALVSWFIVFGLVLLGWTRRIRRHVGRAIKYGAIGSLVVGLALAYLLPSSGYILKFAVMFALSICMGIVGLKYGPRRSAWGGLLAAILGYIVVAFQYVLMEMAR